MRHEPIGSGRRKPVNLSLDTGIVAAARQVGVNLSRVSEAALREAVRREEERRWADLHRPRIEAFAAWLDEHGMPFEEFRVF